MVLKSRLKLEMVAEMHSACVEDNQTEKGVVKAFRMGGWLNARPTKAGLEPLDGAVWDFFSYRQQQDFAEPDRPQVRRSDRQEAVQARLGPAQNPAREAAGARYAAIPPN